MQYKERINPAGNISVSPAGMEPGIQKTLVETNKIRPEDRAVHDWFRFILSFPPHLVRRYVARFRITKEMTVLDPFCGTGTTLVECKKQGIRSVGVEANPFAYFASKTKANWNVDANGLEDHAAKVAGRALARLHSQGIDDDKNLPLLKSNDQTNLNLLSLSPVQMKLLLKDSISPLPLHKALVLLRAIENREDERFCDLEKLAFSKAVVFDISNLHFGPEVGVRRDKRYSAPVVSAWLKRVREIAEDLRALDHGNFASAEVHLADSRRIGQVLQPNSIHAVITSPPYPNEKDYTRTTRLESVLLGFMEDVDDLRTLKKQLVRSNTRGVYKGDDDDLLVSDHMEIQRIADAIEKRRIELGKTSGFERLYSRLTKLYFGGMKRHFSELRSVLCDGALLAYVVGDQASYLRIMIRTGQLLADIAKSLGYEVVDIQLFRTRRSTTTRKQLREEIVLLRWPGRNKNKGP